MKRIITIKWIKITITTLITLAVAYFLYATICSLIMWTWQPIFVAPNESTTRSTGLLVQMGICAGLFIVCLITLLVLLHFFYFKKGIRKTTRP